MSARTATRCLFACIGGSRAGRLTRQSDALLVGDTEAETGQEEDDPGTPMTP